MPSPFPGMDPYIESPVHWPDFHVTFINTLRETIADTLPDPYFARIQEDAVLLEPEPPPSGYKVIPDVLVGADAPDGTAAASAPSGVATLEPETPVNVVALDPHTEYFIEIIRMPAAEVVTVVVVLSPTNTQGDGRGFYMNKRGRLLQGESVSLVEIDLLRAGRRIQLSTPLPQAHHHAFVSRADRRPYCQVYNWTVRHKLPTIPIPLRAPTPDASADLAHAFELAYQRGRYGRLVRYAEPPPPPAFSPEDAAWVTSLAGTAAPAR
jgi:Protein of unknown function (DUF4058)